MGAVEKAKYGTLLGGNNTSLAVKTQAHQAVYTCAILLYIINLLLAISSFTFGTVSWILLSRWRTFQNYVFMNLIFASTVNMIGFNLCAHHKFPDIVVVFLLLVPRIIMSNWLLVATAMFYVDIVKVFNTEISWKYLKANLFSWVLPFVIVLAAYAVDYFCDVHILVPFNYAVNIVILCLNFVIYFIVVHSLLKLPLPDQETRKVVYKKILMVSACGMPSGLSSLFPILIMEVMHSDMVTYNVVLVMCLLTITAGNVAFFCFKQNWVLWAEYRRRRRLINDI